ncbi:type III secretion system protein SsaO [Yersinia aldovae]|uniref:Type III secretion system protein SsaO n=2 Tax=Yersinia aldovae TaxID=29483 RepID=A0ABP1YVC6_YERAL|nr:type III secretion system protein SsaO [Yersinia aldovae]
MQYRRTAATATLSDGQLMLHCLLKIKERREDRLRRQMAELTRQHMQTEVMQNQCQVRRTELAQLQNQLLTWSGTLPANELLEQKQKMGSLFHEVHSMAMQQCTLSDTQKQLQQRLDVLHQELIIIMKKKEKIRGLLNNEYY